MATQQEMADLLGKALADSDFRAALVQDPASAAAGLGFALTDEQLAGLKASDLSGTAEGLDERISKMLEPFEFRL